MEEITIIINQVLRSFGLSGNIEIRKNIEPAIFVDIESKNIKGEKLVFKLSKTVNSGGVNSVFYLWFKEGFTKKLLSSYWCLDPFVYDKDNVCIRAYNPTITKDHKINFDYILEATPENAGKIVTEMIRRFLSA